MYPPGATTIVDVGRAGRCARRRGAARPLPRRGHGRHHAVLLVAAGPRLLRPEGRPAVGRRSAAWCATSGMPVEIVVCPTVREAGRPRAVLAQPLPDRRRAGAGTDALPRTAGGADAAALDGERSADRLRSLMLDALAARDAGNARLRQRSPTPRRSRSSTVLDRPGPGQPRRQVPVSPPDRLPAARLEHARVDPRHRRRTRAVRRQRRGVAQPTSARRERQRLNLTVSPSPVNLGILELRLLTVRTATAVGLLRVGAARNLARRSATGCGRCRGAR